MQTHRININRMQEGIQRQIEQAVSSEEHEQSILVELEQIDTLYLQQLAKITNLEELVQKQQKQIHIKEEEEQKAEEEKLKVQRHLQVRIKSFYKMGEIGLANIAFSAESLPRLLIFRDSFSTLLDYDKVLINRFRDSITELQQSHNALVLEQGILDDFIAQEKIEQDRIQQIRDDKEDLLTQIKTQTNLYEQAVKEMEGAADQLATSLQALKIQDGLLDQGFLLAKGKHPSPLAHKVIALYGEERMNRLNIKSKSTGITFDAPGTNKVQSIYEGTVKYASYLRGYGKTVIIDHGHQFHTVTARVEKLLVEEGNKVKQGEIIALTGDTATIMDDGVYFEIRHGSVPEDPLLWLDHSTLILP